jgi:type VI secretion system protein ImpA
MDVQSFLKPISDSDPVGENLLYEREYDDLNEARRADEPTSQDDIWRREAKRADWDRVIELGTEILLEKSKDLQVAAFMTEAWAHRRGLPGLRDGLELLGALQSEFWEMAYPQCGEDMEVRRGVYEFLDDPKVLPLRIRSVPLTRVEGSPDLWYSHIKYQGALETDKNYNRAQSEEERARLEGNLRGEQFDAAAGQTPRAYYVGLVEELAACRAALERFSEDLAARWPAGPRQRPPRLSGSLTAVEEVERVARKLLARKTAPQEPPPDEPPSDEEAAESPDDGWPEEPVEEPSARSGPPRRSRSSSMGAGPPSSAEEALERIVDAAHYLRRNDPNDPAPYLVLRALGFAGLYRRDDVLASGELPAPSTEVREQLFRMSRGSDGDQWDGLLEEAEQALGQPAGRGWLDPYYYSARALESLGYEGVARACKAALAACLKDHERWPESHLRDGTPCASGPAREWIERECRAAEPAPPFGLAGHLRPPGPGESNANRGDAPADPHAVDGKVEPPDPWEEARDLARSGRLNEAMAVMVQAVRRARTGRERFLRMLEQAELCLACDRPALALPLLEVLAQRVDDLRLDQWEDGSLCARVFSHLYRCLKGKDDARASVIYSRLCQIDASEAFLLGTG